MTKIIDKLVDILIGKGRLERLICVMVGGDEY